MKIRSFAKQEIALHQLETALSLFSQGGDLFSVITLAGAAEEILGQLLPGAVGTSRSRRTLTSIFAILRPASRKESGGAGFSGGEDDGLVHMDPHHEAVFLLGRAIDDYVALSGAPTPEMLKFRAKVRPTS